MKKRKECERPADVSKEDLRVRNLWSLACLSSSIFVVSFFTLPKVERRACTTFFYELATAGRSGFPFLQLKPKLVLVHSSVCESEKHW